MALLGMRKKKVLFAVLLPLVLVLLAAWLLYLAAQSWAGKPLVVNEMAVRQVQGIGKQVGATTVKHTQSDYVISREYLFLSLDAPDPVSALKKSADYLISREWRVDNDRSPIAVNLVSDELEAYVTLSPLDAFPATGGFGDPELEDLAARIQKAVGRSGTTVVAILVDKAITE